MVSVVDYKNVLGTFFRDILRGVDSSGISNGFTSFVHHPNDYESDKVTLKASNLWVDRRTYIRYGMLKKANEDVAVEIHPENIGEIKPSAQGSTCMDLVDGGWKAVIDTTAAKSNQRFWRDKMAAQVLETYTKNLTKIYEDTKILSFTFGVSNTTLNTTFTDELRLFVDTTLDI